MMDVKIDYWLTNDGWGLLVKWNDEVLGESLVFVEVKESFDPAWYLRWIFEWMGSVYCKFQLAYNMSTWFGYCRGN